MKTKNSSKWLLSLGLAMAIGVGAFAQGGRGHHPKGHDGGKRNHRTEQVGSTRNGVERIYRITDADSAQKQKMKPAVDRASKRLESLRASFQKQEKRVMDSLSLQVKPYLKEEQVKKLTDWQSRTHR